MIPTYHFATSFSSAKPVRYALLCLVLVAAGLFVNSPFTASKIDQEFIEHLDMLLDAQPGNPRDLEICQYIRHYGVLNFVRQARLQVQLAAPILKRHPDARRAMQIKGAMPSICIGIAGAIFECVLANLYPRITRLQMLATAHRFQWLQIDVQAVLEMFKE